MYSLLKPFFFALNPERAHYTAMAAMEVAMKLPFVRNLLIQKPLSGKSTLLNKLFIPNAVGLAAGFDKNAQWIDLLYLLGFGHIEVGTVTPLGQPGNPTPRLYRLIKDQALINRMGFNNDGMLKVAKRLEKRKSNVIVGANIGKNKITENANAHIDYLKCFDTLKDVCDYFTVNISSPNTPGLRALQEDKRLELLLHTLDNANAKLAQPRPLLLKIAPDLDVEQIASICQKVNQSDFAGIVATNTTIGRDGLQTNKEQIKKIGAGGLSGKPLLLASNQVLIQVKKFLNPSKKIIGVGGILSEQDALTKLQLGADWVQIYTGFIYKGPELIGAINRCIAENNA